jgi:hypothetical protein
MKLRRLFAMLLLLAGGCRGNLSPLSNRLEIGQEPYLVFTADGEDGSGDLFASKPAGGMTYQITFTRVDERLPALSPDGTMLAFVRSRAPGDERQWRLVVMNLLNGAERQVEADAPAPEAIAWSRDGSRLYARVGAMAMVTPAPPADLSLAEAAGRDRMAADSGLEVLLGEPPLGVAVPCEGGGICARLGGGVVETITATGMTPARWQGDSVAYLEAGEFVVRPLAGGRTRVLRWSRSPGRPRELTMFPGPGRR